MFQLHELRIEATPGLSVERTAFQPQNSLKLFKILKLSNPLHVSPAKRVFIETSNTTVAVAVVVRQGAIFSRLRKCAQAPSEPAPDSHSSPQGCITAIREASPATMSRYVMSSSTVMNI